MADLAFLSAGELSHLIESGELDPIAITRMFLKRVHGPGRTLNCFITLCEETATSEASAAAERARTKRRLGSLDGIPVAVKDNVDVAGVATSNGFGGPPYRIADNDSEVVRRLRAAGAVILGKLNMHEGALGSTNDNPHFGHATNPHRVGRSPGGSSGGSGAAVAAGLCCAALGTDTGGSVRIPASYCGIVGFKPTYGAVSTRGVVPLSYRLDHVGPLTRTVEDAATLLEVLRGFDPLCPDSRHHLAGRYTQPKSFRLDGLKLGVLSNFASEKHDAAISTTFQNALEKLRSLGAEIRRTALPSYDAIKGRRAGFVRVEVEAAYVHGDLYRREPERFSPQMRYYLDYGAKVLGQQLVAADRRIEIAAFELQQCLNEVDAIVSPTTPQAAPAFGERMPENAGTYCILANFAGAPAISMPMGCDDEGLPLGLQIIAAPHQDARVLEVAAAYEAAAGFRFLPPPPIGPAS